jgi:hypothetical protein
MLNVADHVRSGSAGLALDEALQEPVSALLGVTSRAAEALLKIGVETVFDLGSSWLFANAAAAIEASSGRFDVARSDLLQSDAATEEPDDVGALPLERLRGISREDADAIKTALEIATLREFALWPPRGVARRLVCEATGATHGDLAEEQAEALRPRLGEYPTERVYYDALVMLGMGESPDRRPLNGAISLQPVVDDPAGFGQPAVGALVTLSQSWYAKGITLGHMLHSLALAPGEATRIAVVDWSRRTRAVTSESIDEAERLDSATEHSRAVSEVQNAVAEEMQSGGSMSSGWAKSKSKGTGGGFSLGGGIAGDYQGITGVLGFGGGIATSQQEAESWTEASSSSWSVGNRSVMAEMSQRVNDRTEQHSTSVRNRRASAVREVAQSEHEEVSTRIVANYNHMHALTVQYYEVVQIYRVLAQVHAVQRVLFLPFELLDFTRDRADDVVARFRAQLVAAALTGRVRALLLNDRGAVEVRAAVRVRLPIFADVVSPAVVAGRVAMARMIDAGAAGSVGGTSTPQPSPGDGPADPGPTTPSPSPTPPKLRFVRPGPVLDTLPGDAALVAVSFEGVTIDRVRLDQAGVPAANTTLVVPAATDQVDLAAAIPLRTVETIHAAKTTEAADAGVMTLHYESGGVHFSLAVPLDLGEGTSLQKAAYLAGDTANRKEELMTHLQANRAYYTRAVLGGLDSATLVMLLSAFTWKGKPLADQVEPNPLSVAGNFLVLRAPIDADEPAGIGEDTVTWGNLLRDRALTSEQQDARLVPIPTGGVFAEAVLGRSNSAEKLDITRFWNWQDSPIPLTPPEIAPVGTGSRAIEEQLRPGQLSAPVLNIQAPTALPEPAGLSAALTALANGSMFRDMSGLAGTQAMAQAGAAGTLSAATAAGQLASANLKTVTDQAVAMGQTAADMWKALHAPKSGGGSGGAGGGGSNSTVSAEGGRINHGRDMDERGVTESGGGVPSAGSGVRVTEQRHEFQGGGGEDAGAGQAPVSRELAFADIGAAGVSPALLGGVAASLGGTIKVAAARIAGKKPSDILKLLRRDLVNVGKDFDAKLNLSKVTLHSMDKHPNHTAFLGVPFAAWTNSKKDVYVNLDGFAASFTAWKAAGFTDDESLKLARAESVPALRHEVDHLRQFRDKKGRPKDFKPMVVYEEAAYRRSYEWNHTGKAAAYLEAAFGLKKMGADLSKGLEDEAMAFKAASDSFKQWAGLTNVKNDSEYRDKMQDASFLPQDLGKGKDYKVDHLYDGPPAKP